MLTGDLPYGGESPVTVALKHIGDPVPTLDTRKFGISPALAAIVNKLLQKNPENRFSSASEVATALREARERPSVAAYEISDDAPTQGFRSVPPPRRSPLPDHPYTSISDEEERRSRIGGGAIAVLAVLAVVATGLGYWLFGRPLSIPAVGGTTIKLADYTNMTDTQAQAAVVNAGLVAHFIKTSSDTVPANHVIRQNPPPGTPVDKNATIELVVSNGLPTIGLRDVRGYSGSDAQRTLEDDGFKVKLSKRYDNAPVDTVVDQMPKARSQLRKGSIVSLIVSQGQETEKVPQFIGLNVDDATALAKKSGITLDTSQRAAYPNVASNVVASQDIPPGSSIDRNSTVHAIVSNGAGIATTAQNVNVPKVIDTNFQDGVSQLTGAGFKVSVKYSVQLDRNGTIIDQDPTPGTPASSGTLVNVTLSVNGEVPDTEGMTLQDASNLLQSYGYQVGRIDYTSTEGANGRVVRTDPVVGTNLTPGSPVTLVVNGAAH
ncbi:MAG: PASTA domain-containing protein, partial [Candidatus Eremiobacteraeota bacterium]|nr:PASTA domain-containing protein [Candidatus Eremiobacteraeota bacterium]